MRRACDSRPTTKSSLVVDQLVGPLIERRRERVNELFALGRIAFSFRQHAASRHHFPSPTSGRHEDAGGARLSAAVGRAAIVSDVVASSSFVRSERSMDRPLAAGPFVALSVGFALGYAPTVVRQARAQVGSLGQRSDRQVAQAFDGKGLIGGGWIYYLAIGAALGGLVFEYFIEATPVAIPQSTDGARSAAGRRAACPCQPGDAVRPSRRRCPRQRARRRRLARSAHR